MKSQKSRLLWYICPIIFICLVLLSLHVYVVTFQSAARAKEFHTLEQTAGVQVNGLTSKLDGMYRALDNNAKGLTTFRIDTDDQEDVRTILHNIETSNVFSWAGFAGLDGNLIRSAETNENIKEQHYFVQTVAGSRGLYQLNATNDTKDGSFLLTVPVKTQEGGVNGVLVACLPAQNLRELLSSTIYENSGYSLLLNANGDILLDSTREGSPRAGSATLASLLADTPRNNHYSAAEALTAFSAGETYTLPTLINGERLYVTVTPTHVNDWTLLTAIPQDIVNQQMTAAVIRVYVLAAVIILLTTLLSLFFAIESRKKNRQLMQERDELRKSEELYRCLQNFEDNTLFEVDVTTGDITYNREYIENLGRAPVIRSMFQYLEPNPIVYEEDMAEWLRFGKKMNEGVPTSTAELRTISEDGVLIWHRIEYRYLYDAKGVPYRIVGRYTVINEEKNRLESLQRLTETDSLTGLLNHRSMRSKINEILKRDGEDKLHALLVIDIDDFKVVNDTLGHIEGDAVLVHIAHSIQEIFRTTDVIARLGGDEFAVFVRNAPSKDVVVQKAATLVNALQFIHSRDGRSVNVTASIGVAVSNSDANVFEVLYERADTALYQAKSSGKNRYVYFNEGSTMADVHYVSTRHDQDMDGLVPSGNASIQLRALLTHMLGGVLLLEMGPEITPLYISPSYLKIMECEEDALRVMNPMDAVQKDEMPALLELMHTAAATGESIERTYRAIVKGRTVWHNSRAVRIPYEESTHPVLLALVTDVTEPHNNAVRLESIVKTAPLGIALVEIGPEKNPIRFANQQLRSFLDYSDEEFDQIVLPDANVMVHPKYLPGLQAEIKSAIREHRSAEYTVRTAPDLPTRCKWSMFRGVQLEDSGENPLFLMMLTDLTALKTMELQAQASAERYRLAFDQTTATFWEYDFETGKCIQSSATVKEYGLPSSVFENVPDTFLDMGIVHRDSAANYRAFYDQLKSGVPSGSCAIKVRRANGLYDWARISYKSEFDTTGAPHKAVGIIEGVNGMVGAKLRFEHEEWIFETVAVEMIASIKMNLTRGRVDLLFLPGRQALRSDDISPDESIAMAAERFADDRAAAEFLQMMTVESLKEHYSAGEETVSMPYRRKLEDGSVSWACGTARIAIEPSSGDYYCFGYVQNITPRKAWEEALSSPVTFDRDTALYDHDSIIAMIEHSLSTHPGAQNVLLLIDISDFASVERQYGVVRTKALLKSIGDLLTLCVPSEHIAGYLGDGRFAIFMPCIFSEASALDTVDRSLGAIQSRGIFAMGSGDITYTSGIVLADEPEQTFQSLYDSALLTMAEVDAQNLSRYILFTKQM